MWFLLVIGLSGPAIVLLQASLLSFLPAPWNNLNLILCVLLFILFSSDELSKVLALTFWIGFLSELTTTEIFGLTSLSLLITILAAHWFCRNVFTNRSLLAILALGLFSTIFFRLSLWLVILVASIKITGVGFPGFRDYWSTLPAEIALNLTLLAILLSLAQRFTKKMRGVFLIKR